MKTTNRKRRANQPRKTRQYPRLYSCTQQNVVSVSKLAWGYCLALIARFFNFSTRYTAELVADMIKQADEANALPNKEQRNDAKETAHVELVEANDAVCLKWQTLKQYIKDAFPKSLLKIKLDAAGYLHYRKAAGGSWDITLNLIKDAKQFMTDYKAELTANNNMPEGFPDEFSTAATAFETERNRYMSDVSKAKTGTTTKDKAIYDVEVALSKLLGAGKVIFEKEPDNLKKFTFEKLIKEVRGNDPSGLKGYLDSAANGQPLAGVTVSSGEYSTTSDATGKYELKMASGIYDITFEKEGFETLVLKGRVVRVGVMGRFNTLLQEAQPGQALGLSTEADSGESASNQDSGMEQPSAGV